MLTRYKNFFVFFFIFFTYFAIEFITPYHSDDYAYSQMGLNFNNHLNHYLSWSGRFIADYMSTILLSLNSHFLISIILSLCISLVCYFIAALPTKIIHCKINIYILVYILYWVCNVNLGQTTFWIVGACNYLITNFFILLFLYLFLTFKNTNNNFIKFLVFISAIIAGCTNENTSITIIISYILLIFVLKNYDKNLNLYTSLFYIFGLTIGALFLLLAPGNYKRSANIAFNNWHLLSTYDKIKVHVNRVYIKIYHFIPIIVIYFTNFILNLFVNKQKNICFIISLIFVVSTFASLLVFVASPTMPPRSFNGTLIFSLISLSFLLYSLKECYIKKFFLKICTCFIFAIFIYSYSCIAYSYNIAYNEDKIRIEHIQYSKYLNSNAIIPSYYFPKLLKEGDKFDMYHSQSMASYFGIKHIDKPIQVNYNYTIINDIKNILKTISKNTDIILYYKNSNILDKNGTIVIQVDDFNIIKDKYIYVKIFNIRDKKIQILKFENQYIDICGKYYSGLTIKNLNISDICDIEIK